MEGKYLITTADWFYAPDGKLYKAVYGDVKIVSDDALGVKTNRNSGNWYAIVKGEKDEVIIAGCKIHYAVKTDTTPCLYGDDFHEGNPEKITFLTSVNKIYLVT